MIAQDRTQSEMMLARLGCEVYQGHAVGPRDPKTGEMQWQVSNVLARRVSQERADVVDYKLEFVQWGSAEERCILWVPQSKVNWMVMWYAAFAKVPWLRAVGTTNVVACDDRDVYYQVDCILDASYHLAKVKWHNVDEPEWIHHSRLCHYGYHEYKAIIRLKAHKRKTSKRKRGAINADLLQPIKEEPMDELGMVG